MAVKVSNRVKVAILVLVGAVIAGATFIYQKVFGGKVQNIPSDQYIVGENINEIRTEVVEAVQKEEMVAVTYADSPEEGVADVIKSTGNLDFIRSGQRVLVKPNVNSDDPYPGTTNPRALAEVVRLAKAKGAYVVVGDLSNPNYDTISAMKKTGMYDAAKEAGADEIVDFGDGEWVRVKPENAKSWPKGFRIPAELTTYDHIISVPVLHTHSITSHSLAIKNLVGLIHITDRYLFHASSNLNEMIAEIALAVKPSLTVIEGTKAFIEGGPSSGTEVEPKVYLASKDLLAADVVGVELLKKHGAKLKWDDPWESGQIKRLLELGLSKYDRAKIDDEVADKLKS